MDGHPIETYQQRFSVPFEYPVHFTRACFAPDNGVLADAICRNGEEPLRRVQAFVDAGLAAAQPDLVSRVQAYFAAHAGRLSLVGSPELVPGGERSKNSREAAERVMESIARNHLCRQSYVLAVGGGSMLDIVGLAASLVHRGVRLVRVPSTVLAQCDSAVGVKNGIDAYGVKNFAGTFAPPHAVLIDTELLKTLPQPYWVGGLAEAFKVAIIKDADFFEYLETHAGALRDRDEETVAVAVKRAAILHLEHIRTGNDPFEFGTARPLDFGHWSAHRLEVLSGYSLGHGQSVGIGLALDTCYAHLSGLIPECDRDRILKALASAGLTLWSELLVREDAAGMREVLRGLAEFREHLGGRLTVTLPEAIGSRVEVHEMDERHVLAAIDVLQRLYGSAKDGGEATT